MKNQLNLNEMGLNSLSHNEMKEISGGGWFKDLLDRISLTINCEITGVLDGIPGNTHATIFGIKVF